MKAKSSGYPILCDEYGRIPAFVFLADVESGEEWYQTLLATII
jgi:hypothetical protein